MTSSDPPRTRSNVLKYAGTGVAGLVVGLAAGYFVGWRVTAPPRATRSDVANAMLAAVRSPRPGQFNDPESVVRFLLEQVRVQDVDEATRAFPIRETFDRRSPEADLEYVKVLTPNSVLPGAPYRNARLAFAKLDTFDQVTLALLGFDLTGVQQVDPAQIPDVLKKLDRGRLRDLQVKSVTAKRHPADVGSDDFKKFRAGMHITGSAEVDAVVGVGNTDARLKFWVQEIDGQWRVEWLQYP